jgi:DNA replication protein DnaC
MLKTKMSRLEGTAIKFFDRIAKTDLLILDDFGLTHLEKQHQLDLMELIEDRHGKKSTIIVSQLPVQSWYEVIGEETIADAILDRLLHSSYRIELTGDSLRKKNVKLSGCWSFQYQTILEGGQYPRNRGQYRPEYPVCF